MAQKQRKTKSVKIVDIEEEPVIHNIAKIWGKVVKLSAKDDFEGINFLNASQLDLSGMQFIISLKKTYRTRKKEFKIYLHDIPADSLELFARTGFKEIITLVTK